MLIRTKFLCNYSPALPFFTNLTEAWDVLWNLKFYIRIHKPNPKLFGKKKNEMEWNSRIEMDPGTTEFFATLVQKSHLILKMFAHVM